LFTLVVVRETVKVHLVTTWAVASEPIIAVDASSSIVTGRGATCVQINLTILARIVIVTDTQVVINNVIASASIEAGLLQCTIIHVHLALATDISWSTRAVEPIQEVLASGAMETWDRVTLVDINFAVLARVPRITVAAIVIDQVIAVGSVLAGVQFAFVQFLITPRSREPSSTTTSVASLGVIAGASILTGIGNTLINIVSTDISSPASSTGTAEAVKLIL
jgi:hypothetical protein